MTALTFVLNDENKVNQFGFRVRNAGLDMDRFKANPILLSLHDASKVFGRWENIKIEDGLLKADAVFDEEDPEVTTIAGKVKRGFLKGASLGLNPFSMDNFQLAPDGKYDLVESEILEASIVPLPNNANSIKLYATTKEGIESIKDSEVPQILLMVNEIKNHKSKKMTKIKLTAHAALAAALNADAEHSTEDISGAILNLKGQLDAANQKIVGFEQLEKDKQAKLAADTVDADIKSGKIDATKRADFIKLFAENSAMYKTVIASIPAKTDLAGQIGNPATPTEVKTLEDFQKLDLSAQLRLKDEQPELYKSLFI